jgi:3',5'-cyclic AMP phosphodiesterase CpdA
MRMAAGKSGAGAVAILAATVLTFAAPPAPETRGGPFTIPLAEVDIAIEALGEAAKSLPGEALRGKARAAMEILWQARATAGEPASLPVPGPFAHNLAAGPYLQLGPDGDVRVRWAAMQSDAVVRYGLGGKLTSTAPARRLASPRWMREARLTGLKRGAEYGYSVRIGGKDVGGTFRTSPEADGSFTFAVWGDSQCFPDVFGGVAAQMAKHPVDLAVCTGDAVEEGLANGDYYRQLFQPAREVLRSAFLVLAVGNHERISDPGLARCRRFIRAGGSGETYFAMTYANCRFVVLDSTDKGLFGGRQLQWLKRELASDACRRARFRFLFLHHAPFCWDWYGGQRKVQEVVVPLAEKHKVDAVFAGHFHCYERGARATSGRQTFYVVNGGGAGRFTDRMGPGRHDRDFMTKHAWKHHFVLVSIDPAGLKAQAIDDKGQAFDEFTIARPASSGAARPRRRTPPALTLPPRPVLGGDDARFCTLSAEQRRAALAALDACRRQLGQADREAAERMASVAGMLEDARDLTREGTWAGSVERTAHRVPRLIHGGIHYRLKPSERADASVGDLLYQIGHSDDKRIRSRRYEVKGLDTPMLPLRWILVDSITAK